MDKTHGGDVLGFEAVYGKKPLDFSVNTNPLGMPPAALAAAKQALETVGAYPDTHFRALAQPLARRHGCIPDHLVFGNGAADLIFRICAAVKPQKALVTAPAFAEYEQGLKAAGARIQVHALCPENQFDLTESFLEAIGPDTDLVFLCEPANPTGRLTPKPLLERVLERCEQQGAYLVIDECFNGFVDDPLGASMVSLAAEHPRLFVLRAFTKLYAMAGLRLGYGICSDSALLEVLRSHTQPWPVSSIAQAAGAAALQDEEYLRRTRRWLRGQKEWLVRRMCALGLTVYDSQANYLLFYTERPGFFEEMARQGILVRDCSNYQGLGEGYYRTAVLMEEENRRLAQALEKALEAGAR